MNHLDLFSGIGGFSLAASWVWKEEHNIVSFVEIDPFCQKVLKKHWPGVPIHGDIRSYKHDGTTIDLLTGGFPCQPFSQVGKQRGKEDDRYLWPAMLECISKVHPTWIIGENVAGITSMALDQVYADMEDTGYTCQAFDIPACSINARHKRRRIFILAHATSVRWGWGNNKKLSIFPKKETISNIKQQGRCGWNDLPKPYFVRGSDDVPNRVDRLKSLGNAIVPQVVVPIMEAIKKLSPNKASAEAHE